MNTKCTDLRHWQRLFLKKVNKDTFLTFLRSTKYKGVSLYTLLHHHEQLDKTKLYDLLLVLESKYTKNKNYVIKALIDEVMHFYDHPNYTSAIPALNWVDKVLHSNVNDIELIKPETKSPVDGIINILWFSHFHKELPTRPDVLDLYRKYAYKNPHLRETLYNATVNSSKNWDKKDIIDNWNTLTSKCEKMITRDEDVLLDYAGVFANAYARHFSKFEYDDYVNFWNIIKYCFEHAPETGCVSQGGYRCWHGSWYMYNQLFETIQEFIRKVIKHSPAYKNTYFLYDNGEFVDNKEYHYDDVVVFNNNRSYCTNMTQNLIKFVDCIIRKELANELNKVKPSKEKLDIKRLKKKLEKIDKCNKKLQDKQDKNTSEINKRKQEQKRIKKILNKNNKAAQAIQKALGEYYTK